LQRDFLLSLAVEGLYRPVWSDAILEELEYHEAEKLTSRHGIDPADAAARADRLTATMRTAFADAEIRGWESLDGSFGLPDADDEHVVAAAVIAGAGAIVTNNQKHFPREKVPQGIDILRPAEFAANTVSLEPAAALRAVEAIAARSGRLGARHSVDEVFALLEARYQFTDAVADMRLVLGERS
jgi:hypothetical protein